MSAEQHVNIALGERRGGESHDRFRLVVRLRLEVGDGAGDLAERGFKTTEHKPCPPRTLTFAAVSEWGSRGSRRDNWSSSPGVPRELIDQIDTWEKGWDHPRAVELSAFAERWHLNTMRAGCAHMTPVLVGDRVGFPSLADGHIDEMFTVQSYVGSDYGWFRPGEYEPVAHRDLADKTCWHCGHKSKVGEHRKIITGVDHYGANRAQECSAGSGYSYGSAWLVEPLPPAALEYLAGLGLPAPFVPTPA